MNKIKDILLRDNLIMAVISNRRKSGDAPLKITVSLMETGFQFANFYENKVLHNNIEGIEKAADEIIRLLPGYKNLSVFTEEADYQILTGKKGNVNIKKSAPSKKPETQAHNKKKNYLLTEGQPYDFLTELGITEPNGRVKAPKYNKFVQINRYLEIIESISDRIVPDSTIIDFGCGKAYLTFALYYYFNFVRRIPVKIIGVDLKEQVVKDCNALADKLGYGNLEFIYGDIKDYSKSGTVDMVVSLHACDTSTDEAIIKAVEWNSKVIVSVPCCHHELFGQIENEVFEPLTRYGIIKDKLATLVTDSMRGLALEAAGYKVKIMEFTSDEHTAKNIMISARYTGNKSEKAMLKYKELEQFWNCKPYIGRLIE